jgi:2-polyprenyl-3-methyl-5-hydroxy-6-metoxy-1,4-benzoquinol methylase
MNQGEYRQSEFDHRAREWDQNRVHTDRSVAVAAALKEMIPLKREMKALEYGAGTGILSFLLRDEFREIILMDNSKEMIQVCMDKVKYFDTSHLSPLVFDLEHDEYKGSFDIIFNQMVLHHVADVQGILGKFHSLLNPGGFLAIADLYPEDGSFHDPGVQVHTGFDPELLGDLLGGMGFRNISSKPCFVVKRDTGTEYPVFLMVAQKLP